MNQPLGHNTDGIGFECRIDYNNTVGGQDPLVIMAWTLELRPCACQLSKLHHLKYVSAHGSHNCTHGSHNCIHAFLHVTK